MKRSIEYPLLLITKIIGVRLRRIIVEISCTVNCLKYKRQTCRNDQDSRHTNYRLQQTGSSDPYPFHGRPRRHPNSYLNSGLDHSSGFTDDEKRTNGPSNATPKDLRCKDGILRQLDVHDAEIGCASLRDNNVLFLEKSPQARPHPTMRDGRIVLNGNVVDEWWNGYMTCNRMELLQSFS